MDEEANKAIPPLLVDDSSTFVILSGTKPNRLLPDTLITDLAVPLPDIPALSLPETAGVPFTVVTTSNEDLNAAAVNTEECEDDYMCMNESIVSEAPLIPLVTAGAVPAHPDTSSLARDENSMEPQSAPYEVPATLLPPVSVSLASTSSHSTVPEAFPLSPPSQPPPSPPAQPPPSPPARLPPSPSSWSQPPPSPPSQPPTSPPFSPSSPPQDEADADDLYEDVISGTLDDANDEPVLYMDIAEPSPDDTYDDIPANSNESYVEIFSNDQVRMTVAAPSGHSEAYLLENSSNSPAVLTGFQGLSEEAPPSYDDIFGGPSAPTQASVPLVTVRQNTPRQAVIQRPTVNTPRPTITPNQDSQNNVDGSEHWCLSAVNKSPIKTGIYLFIFLLGIFVPLGMLGLGVGLYLTTTSGDSSSDLSNNTPVYLIVMGSFTSFFVCWHTTALVVGAYVRAHNSPQRHSSSSCCLRILHCGGLFWWGALGYLSYQVYNQWESITFDILTIVVLGFIVFQYLMVLYCCLEACIDCRGCIKERLSYYDS